MTKRGDNRSPEQIKAEKAADRLEDVARRTIERAEAEYSRPRNMNTARRARLGSGVQEDQLAKIANAKTALKIASALRQGEAGTLSKITSLADVERIQSAYRTAMYANEEKRKQNRGSMSGVDPTPDDIRHAKPTAYVRVHVFQSDIEKLKTMLAGKGVTRELARIERTLERDGSWIQRDPKVIEAFEKVAKAIKKHVPNPKDTWRKENWAARDAHRNANMWLSELRDYEAKKRLGLTDASSLRQTLSEYVKARTDRRPADPIKAMELNLVGRKIPGFFPTPEHLAKRMAELADLQPGQSVLEPSAGTGRLADVVKKMQPGANVSVVESVVDLQNILKQKGHSLVDTDFTAMDAKPSYDRVIMNPPFEKGQDMAHVRRAYDMLKPGGKMVAIMGEGAFFRSDRTATEFRSWLDDAGGTSEKLPEGSFKESNTGVNTRLVTISKPPEAARPSDWKPERPTPLAEKLASKAPVSATSNSHGNEFAPLEAMSEESRARLRHLEPYLAANDLSIQGRSGIRSKDKGPETYRWRVVDADRRTEWMTEAQLSERAKGWSDAARAASAEARAAPPAIESAVERAMKASDAKRASETTSTLARPPVAKAPTKKIEDLGEKIGGARKDLAARSKSKPRASKPRGPALPMWERDFIVMENMRTGKWNIHEKPKGRSRMAGRPLLAEGFDTEAQAQAARPLAAVAKKHQVRADYPKGPDGKTDYKNPTYEIWRKVTDRKQIKVVGQSFATKDDAMAYMAKNAKDIIEIKTSFGEEILAKPEKVLRTGPQVRTGDVKGETFRKAFGFRGVEFGNWNNQVERQQVMNHAHDAMKDLSRVTGISERALALNDDLGLAFGARGQGLSGARAHYEPAKAVINLTKMAGAGHKAHEWWHAFDHVLARTDRPALAKKIMGADGTPEFDVSTSSKPYASEGMAYKSELPTTVQQAMKNLMESMYRKPVQYQEDATRSETWAENGKKELDQKLTGLRQYLEREQQYGKRFVKPATPEQLARFDAAAARIKAGEVNTSWVDDPNSKKRFGKGRHSNPALEELSAVMKEVRGRNGFGTPQRPGDLDRLRGTMRMMHDRLTKVDEAQKGVTKTRMVPTDYLINARNIDRGRATDYWSVPREMSARAFSAFVEDQLAGKGQRSDFLSFGSTNDRIDYRMLNVKPFPEGAERTRINQQFATLFQEVNKTGILKNNQGWQDAARAASAEARAAVAQPQKANAVALAASGGPVIGREWDSPYGRQRITSIIPGNPAAGMGDMVEVSTVGKSEVRRYDASRIEETIKGDMHRTTPAYQEELKDQAETRRLREEASSRQAAAKAAKQAEVKEFTDSAKMSRINAKKAENALFQQIRSDGNVTTRKALIEDRVANGWKVETIEIGGKTVRGLTGPDGQFMDQRGLTKTGLDYAEHLTKKTRSNATAPRNADFNYPGAERYGSGPNSGARAQARANILNSSGRGWEAVQTVEGDWVVRHDGKTAPTAPKGFDPSVDQSKPFHEVRNTSSSKKFLVYEDGKTIKDASGKDKWFSTKERAQAYLDKRASNATAMLPKAPALSAAAEVSPTAPVKMMGIPADGSKPFLMAVLDIAGDKKEAAERNFKNNAHLYTQKLAGYELVDNNGNKLIGFQNESTQAAAQEARAKAKSPAGKDWLMSLPEETKQKVFAEMRSVDAEAQAAYNIKGRQPGVVEVGSADFDSTIKGAAYETYLRAIRNGETPESAESLARSAVRKVVETHNGRRTGDVNWARDAEFGQRHVDNVKNAIQRAAKPEADQQAPKKTVATLKAEAKAAGIKGYSKMSKATLLDKLGKGANKLGIAAMVAAPATAALVAYDATRNQAMAAGSDKSKANTDALMAGTVAGGATAAMIYAMGKGIQMGIKAAATVAPKIAPALGPVGLGIAAAAMGYGAYDGYQKGGMKGAALGLLGAQDLTLIGKDKTQLTAKQKEQYKKAAAKYETPASTANKANAGWTDEARIAAAMKRGAKTLPYSGAPRT